MRSASVGAGFGPFAELAYVLSGRLDSDSPITTLFGVTSTFFWSF